MFYAIHNGAIAFSNGKISRLCLSSSPHTLQDNPFNSRYDGDYSCRYSYRLSPEKKGCMSKKKVVLSSSDSSNDNGKQPKKWRKLPGNLNPLTVILQIYNKSIKNMSKFRAKFKSLSKKGKLLFSVQVMTLMIILGFGSNRVVSNVRSHSSAAGSARSIRSRPVEVPYSVFMDMVEKSGKVSLRSLFFRRKPGTSGVFLIKVR